MNGKTRILLISLWLVLSGLTVMNGADSPRAASGPAGHWAGVIALPTTKLEVSVDLEKGSNGWTGTIDIPVQNLRAFPLSKVSVIGSDISFALAGIPGNPIFGGELDAAAKEIVGGFSQGGQTFPFKLERKAKTIRPGETPARGQPGKGLAGNWQGSLKATPLVELRLVLELTNTAAGKTLGVMISVDQGGARMPIDSMEEKEGAVRFEIKSVAGAFSGKINADGSEMGGEWTQGGNTLPLVFKRIAKVPTLSRSQEPRKPYPYNEEEVEIENGAVKLAGTFSWPKSVGPFPAVILITGSGAQDRDEAVMGHRPFLVLSDHLVRQGIAVLRCDDRGFGKSKGNFAAATQADFVTDVLAQVAWMGQRKEVDGKRLGLMGHSEGGMIAPRVAVKSPEVGFIVLLAGVGVPMEELLLRQSADLTRASGVGEETIAKNAAIDRQIFAVIRKEAPAVAREKVRALAAEQLAVLTDEQRKALGVHSGFIEQQVQMITTPWFRDVLDYDPVPTFRAVRCPVLAINGEKDLQVAAKENLEGIRKHIQAGGNQRVKTVEMPGLNHLFQRCETGSPTEYAQIEETMNPAVLKLVSDWILETASK